MTGAYGIAPTDKIGYIPVSSENLVKVEEIDGDAVVGETENGKQEQGEVRIKEILGDE
jgi:hypothetical protein